METNGKTDDLNRSRNTGANRLTPSELRERLFQEQEARIAELVKHNAELTIALEHEREQSRRHASAHQIAQEMLITAGRKAPDADVTHVPSAVHPAVMFSGWVMALPGLLLSLMSVGVLSYHSLSYLAGNITFWQIGLTVLCVLTSTLLMLKAAKIGNNDKLRLISNGTQMAIATINIGAVTAATFRVSHIHKADWYALGLIIILSVCSVGFNNIAWKKWLLRRRTPTTVIPTQDSNTPE